MGTDRTSEPESLNIGTPFQMTLEAVGTHQVTAAAGQRTAPQNSRFSRPATFPTTPAEN